jgi:hypothetical protein
VEDTNEKEEHSWAYGNYRHDTCPVTGVGLYNYTDYYDDDNAHDSADNDNYTGADDDTAADNYTGADDDTAADNYTAADDDTAADNQCHRTHGDF